MICPRCGAQASGKFCASCGAKLQQQCAACGALLTAADKFCGECGASVDASRDSPAAGGGKSVAIGDIGVMRGTIDQSTHSHTTIGSQVNVSGDIHLQMSREGEATYEEMLAQGRQNLSKRLYAQAKELFARATQTRPDLADGFYYLALTTLQGKRPKLITLATVKTAEGHLRTAVETDPNHTPAKLLWALVKQDAYVLNGMSDRPPTVTDLLQGIGQIERSRIREITEQVQAPGNRVWEAMVKQ